MNQLLLENVSHEDLKKYLLEFYSYALTKLNINRPPKLFFQRNKINADNLFGKTGYYDPEKEEIHLFITDRHAKDIIRSFAHELIHHMQKLKGFDQEIDLSKTSSDPAYATNDPVLRKMEKEAFLEGNMLFRDWTDMKKLEMKKMLNEKKESTFKEKEAAIKKSLIDQGKTAKQAKKIAPKIAGAEAAGRTYQGPGKPMKEVSYEKSGLNNPTKADLDKNQDISGYEKARGKAIEKSMKEENNMKVKVNEVEKEDTEELSGTPEDVAGLKAGSRNLGDEPEGVEPEEEMELDVSDEEEKLGGGLPMKSAEQMAFEKRFGDMDPEMQGRFLARLAQQAKDKKAAKIALSAELNREERAAQKEKERAGFASLPGAKPPMEEASATLAETKQNPYPVLFEKKDRLLKETFNTREERIYNELVKRFLKK